VVTTLTASNGCDSVVTTITTLLSTKINRVNIITCNPVEVGIDTLILLGNNGCDSLIITTTSLRNNLDTTIVLILNYGGTVTLPDGLEVSEIGIYTIEYSTVDGCDSIVTVLVEYDPEEELIKIPNTFTPNNDGFNDVFFAYTFFELESYSMSIFDSWGENVFKSNSIDIGWDGTYKGKPMNTGVFFVLVRSKIVDMNEDIEVKKLVKLVR
jgi:gliding motility-associated-like protein